eukprot:GILJ01000643.1.p1 GENE.GILJ01000643.1~~GILJ01000643.1.p1  ORF type:complete len:190 (-),score=20.66 GILJ01000643.1:199-768(-)
MSKFGEDLAVSATSMVVISQHELHETNIFVRDGVNIDEQSDGSPQHTYLAEWEAGKRGDSSSDSSVESEEDDQSEASRSDAVSSKASIQQRHVLGALTAGVILGLVVGALWTRRKMSNRVLRVEQELQVLRDELAGLRSGSVRKDIQNIRAFLNDWLFGLQGLELFRVGEFKQWRHRLLHTFVPVKLID